MGAYENPITAINKEWGKNWANALTSVGNTVAAGVIAGKKALNEKAAREQSLLDSKIDYITKQQGSYAKTVAQSGINNPDLLRAGRELINDMAEAQLNVKKAKGTQETQYALDQLAILQGSMAQLTKGIQVGGAADETFKNDIGINGRQKDQTNPGTEGGQSLLNANYNRIFSTRTGLSPYTTERYLRNRETGAWTLEYSGEDFGEEGYSVDMMVGLSQDPGIIPTLTKDITSDLETSSTGISKSGMNGLGILDSSGNITEDFLLDGPAIPFENEIGNKIETYYVRRTDTQKVINLVTARSEAKGNMYLKKDAKGAQMIWQEIFGQTEPLTMEGNSIATEDHTKFQEKLLEFYKGKIKGYEIVEGAQPGPDGKMGTSDDIAKIENIDNEQESKRSYRDKKPPPKPVDMNPAKAFKETKTAFNTAISSGNWGDIVDGLVIEKKTIESSKLKGNILTLNYKLALKTADGQSWYPTGDMKIDISNMTELRKLSELYVDKRFTHKKVKAKRDDIVRELMKVFKNASKNNENATGVFGRSSGQNKMGPINEKGKYNKP
jgi:hypothetical protein